MADIAISGLTALGAAPATNDLVPFVDVSDTSQAPTGTTKKMTVANLFTTPTITTSVTVTGGTVTASTPLVNATQTWNNAAVDFTALKLNVTNTASGAASKLLDLEVGGASFAYIDKTGAMTVVQGLTSGSVTTGQVTATNVLLSNTGAIMQRSGATNSAVYENIINTPVNSKWGNESTTGGGVFTGSSANVMAIGTASNSSIEVVTNNVVALTITGAQLCNFAGRVGIGASPATSAALEISSTTGALLVPRMTNTQRDALTAVNGMIIYSTTDNQMQARLGGSWQSLT